MARGHAPEVVGTHRSPATAPQREAEPKPEAAILGVPIPQDRPAPTPTPSGKRRFGGPARAFRLTVQTQIERRDANGITLVPARFQDLVFEDGQYETDDPVVIDAVLKSRPFMRGVVYDVDALRALADRKAAEALISGLDRLPDDLKDQIRSRLGITPGQKDFAIEPEMAPA